MKIYLILLLAIVYPHTQAYAYYCNEPSEPYCASKIMGFEDEYEFDKCKREVTDFLEGLKTFVECVQRGVADDAEITSNSVIDDFNRRTKR